MSANVKDDLADIGSDLYLEYIVDHFKNPRNAGTLDPADIRHEGDNPTCGDMIEVFVRLRGDVVEDVRFKGEGCAISQASASLFYETTKGVKLDRILGFNLDTIQGLLGITLRPARVKCGMLPLSALQEGIRKMRAQRRPARPLPGFSPR